MTTRVSLLSARRLTRVAAPLLVAALALGACSDDEPTAAPSRSATPSETPTPSDTPTPTPSDTPTVTVSPSATPSVTPSPSQSPTATATQAPSPKPSPTRSTSTCPAAKAGATTTSGMSAAAAATARKLHAAAKACDAATLVSLAKNDSTGLAGDQAPSTIFTAGTPQNFVALATLLALPATATFDGTIQPRVFSEKYAQTDAEWEVVIDAGLVTRAAATKMRQDDGGYTGYRVGIAEDGTWTFFTSGR
jgi:hypothetical protein